MTKTLELKLFSDYNRGPIMEAAVDPAIMPVGIPSDLLEFVTLDKLDSMVGKTYRVTTANSLQYIYRMEGYHLCHDYVLDNVTGNNHFSEVLNKNGRYLDSWHVVDRRNGALIYAQDTEKKFPTLSAAASSARKSMDWIRVCAVCCFHDDDLHGPRPSELNRKPGIVEIKLLSKPKRK